MKKISKNSKKRLRLTMRQTELLVKVGGEELTLAQKSAKLRDVLKEGVKIDDQMLVVPDAKNPKATIARSLVEVKRLIDEQRSTGKHIIYIPGSYDLVHAGHASYALQVIDQYLLQHPDLTRDDLYVVMLSDDDELIKTVKAYKRKGYSAKGDEDFERPIESAEAFEDLNLEHHPRLIGTASLPVDLVGFIPAPENAKEFINELLAAQKHDVGTLTQHLEDFMAARELAEVDKRELSAAIQSYGKLLHCFGNGGYDEVIASFRALGKPYAKVDPEAPWSIQSYQLLIHGFLAAGDGLRGPIVRIVSVHDNKYKDQVDFLMEAAGLDVEPIEDVELVSTTKLLREFGAGPLRSAKRRHLIGR